jgi:quinol monooxygenase YgiN
MAIALDHRHEYRVARRHGPRNNYELYRDRAVFEAHEQQPHTRHFLTEREHLVESFTVDWLRPTAQAGMTRAHA